MHLKYIKLVILKILSIYSDYAILNFPSKFCAPPCPPPPQQNYSARPKPKISDGFMIDGSKWNFEHFNSISVSFTLPKNCLASSFKPFNHWFSFQIYPDAVPDSGGDWINIIGILLNIIYW